MTDPVERQWEGTLDDVGDLHLATVVVNTQDMDRAVRFWTRALGYRPDRLDPGFTMLLDPAGVKPAVSLQITDHPPAEPVRVHLDLYTSETERHIERLVGLGATRVTDWQYPKDADFVVLRDPDGNEFCVIDHSDG